MLLRLAAASLLLFTGCLADTTTEAAASTVGSGSAQGGPHGPPPQEAIDACASSAAGDACAFTIDGHDVTGTCRAAPDGHGPLACAPDHQMPPPPQEALDACASSSSGATCSFTFDGHDITGTCKAGPDGTSALACAPDQPPAPPAPPQEAIDACASSSSGATCSFTFDGHAITGTCKAGPDGTSTLACAPDQPPPMH